MKKFYYVLLFILLGSVSYLSFMVGRMTAQQAPTFVAEAGGEFTGKPDIIETPAASEAPVAGATDVPAGTVPTSQPEAGVKPSASPNTIPDGTPVEVLNLVNEGSTRTKEFTVNSVNWGIDWTTTLSDEQKRQNAKDSTFILFVHNNKNEIVANTGFISGTNSGSLMVSGAGTYTIRISTSQKWTVKVRDWKIR